MPGDSRQPVWPMQKGRRMGQNQGRESVANLKASWATRRTLAFSVTRVPTGL